jgi:tetratricopeptide (TPR) repeat protein
MQARRRLRSAIRLVDEADPGSDPAVRAEWTELLVRVWITVATAESELQGLQAGLDALARAEQALDGLSLPHLQVLIYTQRGYLQIRVGNLESALAELDRAMELLNYADDEQAHSILFNRGTAHLLAGKLRPARADLERASAIAVRLDHTADLAMTRHNLGYLEFLSGNLAAALEIMDDARDLGADISVAVNMLDRARVLIEAGLHLEADAVLARAAEMVRADRVFGDLAEVELARAECALLEGEVEAARRFAVSARNRFRRRGNERWRRDAELLVLQADLAAGRPGARLATPALRLAENYRLASLDTQARTATLVAADALRAAGRIAEAWQTAAAAGDIRRGDPITPRLHTRLVRARLHVSRGGGGAARREIRAGLAELAHHQAQFGSIDAQTASAVHGRALVELNIGLALSENRPRAMFSAVEEGRAMSSRVQPVVAPVDPAVADMLAELRLLSEEIRLVASDPREAAAVASNRRRMADLQQELRSHSWHWQGSGTSQRPASVTQIEAELADADAVGVSFVASGGGLYGLVVTSSTVRLVNLGGAGPVIEVARRARADLDVLAGHSLPAALVPVARASLQRCLDKLDIALMRSLALPDTRLVLWPTGPLAMLPWGLLDSLRGRPLVVAASASAWLRAREIPHRTDGPVAALAGPGLAYSDSEAAGVAAIWDKGSTLTGADANRSALRAAMRSNWLVHLAAHGQHQAENPLFSSVLLADGPVFAWELDRAAEHVVLSACELGQSTIRPGNEALGLTSVLLRLGARTVISGVSRVHDATAALVMTRYHSLLRAGLDPAAALAQACSEADERSRSGSADETARPAAFVSFGAA